MPAIQNEEAPIITGGKSSNKFIKIALIVLGIVLLVVVSEVAYYLYSEGGFGQTQESESISSISQPTPAPTVLFKKSINVEKIKAFAAGFESLKPKESFYDKATVNTSVTGEVVSAYSDRERINDFEVVYAIKLKNEIGQILTYRLTQDEIDNVHIVLVGSSANGEIEIQQIQKGDQLNIKETINLLDESPNSRLIFEVRR